MDRRYLLAAAVAAVAWLSLESSPAPAPAPGPTPNPADVQQLRAAFGANDVGRLDCLRFGVLCSAIGDRLEADTRLPAEQRRLKTSGQLHDFRRQVREDYLGAQSLNATYPLLADFLRAFFTSRVGDMDEKLDDTRRQQWAVAFRDLAGAATEASQ